MVEAFIIGKDETMIIPADASKDEPHIAVAEY